MLLHHTYILGYICNKPLANTRHSPRDGGTVWLQTLLFFFSLSFYYYFYFIFSKKSNIFSKPLPNNDHIFAYNSRVCDKEKLQMKRVCVNGKALGVDLISCNCLPILFTILTGNYEKILVGATCLAGVRRLA
jgi:hypothetical protein